MYSDGSSLQRLSRDECLTLLASVPVVTDPGELARLRTMGLKSWAPGERDHFIRISPVMLNGRHLRAGCAQPTQRSA